MNLAFAAADKTVFQHDCPACQQPLHILHFHGCGYWLGWLDWETHIDRCPSCHNLLPELSWDAMLQEPVAA